MIESIQFENFKVLRNTKPPLEPFTLIVGPNGSGKTTALQALEMMGGSRPPFESVASVGPASDASTKVVLRLFWGPPLRSVLSRACWTASQGFELRHFHDKESSEASREEATRADAMLKDSVVYSLNASAISKPCELEPGARLKADGAGLAAVLDRLRDEAPDRYERLNEELGRLLIPV